MPTATQRGDSSRSHRHLGTLITLMQRTNRHRENNSGYTADYYLVPGIYSLQIESYSNNIRVLATLHLQH